MGPTEEIRAGTPVARIMREHPELTDYLLERNLCGCEYGPGSHLALGIAEAARRQGQDPDEIVAELNRRIRG